MKLLLDSCVAKAAVSLLGEAGHDVHWTGDWAEDPGDDVILARAAAEGRVFVTLDKDFGELAIVHGHPHHGILRLVGLSTTEQGPTCREVLARHEDVLVSSGIVTVERTRVRVRPAGPR